MSHLFKAIKKLNKYNLKAILKNRIAQPLQPPALLTDQPQNSL